MWIPFWSLTPGEAIPSGKTVEWLIKPSGIPRSMLAEAVFRTATISDASAICEVYLASRKQFLPYAPLAHADEEVCKWIANSLIPNSDVCVALVDGEIVGMMAVSQNDRAGWIDQMYVHPQAVGQGIGTRFIKQAKTKLGSPIRLYTFQANAGARRFYERNEFKAIAYGDGSGNEEKCPDVLYEWREQVTYMPEMVR
jgi:GNAT superfamily N-acetyltransferase